MQNRQSSSKRENMLQYLEIISVSLGEETATLRYKTMIMIFTIILTSVTKSILKGYLMEDLDPKKGEGLTFGVT